MKVPILVLITILNSCFATQLISRGDIEDLLKRALNKQLTAHEYGILNDVIEILRRPKYVSTRREKQAESEFRTTLDCILCKSGASVLFHLIRLNENDDNALVEIVAFFCIFFGIQTKDVCHGMMKLNMPIIAYIVRKTPEATPEAFCGLVLQQANNPNICPFSDPRFEWQVELPPKPNTVTRINTSAEPLTIALFTDAHIDPLYEAFGIADCCEPICCRKGQKSAQIIVTNSDVDESVVGKSIVNVDGEVYLDLSVVPKIREMKSAVKLTSYSAATRSPPAGYWGDYRKCDTPIWAFNDVIDRIAESHKDVDVVYYIGDSIAHAVWETTYDLITGISQILIKKIRKTFGDDVLVVPVIGNHEAQPINQFAPSTITGEGLNTTWLYEMLINKWSFYLSDDAKETMRERGEFSRLIAPGLRAISLNNNVAYRYNWWLVYDPTDAKKHLDWLVEELYKAEQAGEKVHLLMHIPPGVDDLMYTWTREYNRIVNRFSTTIAAQFNGHTHADEFKIFYNDDLTPISVAWNAGGTTTYTHYNLNYKIVTLDSYNFEPSGIQNYVYNLTEANLNPHRRPQWFMLYDMKNTFHLSNLSAVSIDDLATRMVTTHKHLLDLYSVFYSKSGDSNYNLCDENCKLEKLCNIVITVLWDRKKCEELVALYHK